MYVLLCIVTECSRFYYINTYISTILVLFLLLSSKLHFAKNCIRNIVKRNGCWMLTFHSIQFKKNKWLIIKQRDVLEYGMYCHTELRTSKPRILHTYLQYIQYSLIAVYIKCFILCAFKCFSTFMTGIPSSLKRKNSTPIFMTTLKFRKVKWRQNI